jgi:alpha-D-ribose 1-methylphosphonate 5-triphosphate synthase subunit PhnG
LQDVEVPMREVDPKARKEWISTLAKAPPTELRRLIAELPAHDLLRAAEVGAVMVRGRLGGTGAPFNLGEMTVTRCSVRLANGTVGHAWVQGRDKDHARRAAVVDALMQTDAAADVERDVIAPLAEVAHRKRSARADKAAGTKVDFFTMARGEDQ